MIADLADYSRHVWRKVNDAIIWSALGHQRHMVKRLCLYRRRTYLTENNDLSALATIKQLNADPLALAIWNDATSCVDIGDVTLIPNGLAPHPVFLESRRVQSTMPLSPCSHSRVPRLKPVSVSSKVRMAGRPFSSTGVSQGSS